MQPLPGQFREQRYHLFEKLPAEIPQVSQLSTLRELYPDTVVGTHRTEPAETPGGPDRARIQRYGLGGFLLRGQGAAVPGGTEIRQHSRFESRLLVHPRVIQHREAAVDDEMAHSTGHT